MFIVLSFILWIELSWCFTEYFIFFLLNIQIYQAVSLQEFWGFHCMCPIHQTDQKEIYALKTLFIQKKLCPWFSASPAWNMDSILSSTMKDWMELVTRMSILRMPLLISVRWKCMVCFLVFLYLTWLSQQIIYPRCWFHIRPNCKWLDLINLFGNQSWSLYIKIDFCCT